MRGVAAFEGDGGQRLLAGDLEYRAQQDGPPDGGSAMFCCQRLNLGGGEITVRRGKVEIEIQGLGHKVLQIAAAVLLPQT